MWLLWVLALIAVLALPVAAGFALARLRSQIAGFAAGLWAGLALMAAFQIFAGYLAINLPPDQPSPLALPALLVFSLIAWLMGFGLGFCGHSLGKRKA